MLANTQSIRCAFCLTCQKTGRRDSTLRIVRYCLETKKKGERTPCRDVYKRQGVRRTGAVGVLKIFALNVPIIAGDPTDHAVCCAGDNGGVQRVVQIAVRAHLGKPPAFAQMRRYRAADGENALFAKRFGLRKCKITGLCNK